MFKKLQNKFLMINIISIFTVFVISLGIIYMITYTNVQKENKDKLEQGSGINLTASTNVSSIPSLDISKVENINAELFFTQKVSTDFSVPFNLILNSNNEIVKINSYLDMSQRQYEELVKLALEDQNSDILSYDGKSWIYQISSFAQYEIEQGYAQQTKQISFLDITESVNSLNQLLVTLISVGLFMLILIYFISLHFAKKAISPIKEAWKKQKQFVEDASHELKTPIAAIKANTDVLVLNPQDSIQSQMKWIEYIKFETSKMSELVSKLLNLAKIENQQEPKSKKSFDLSQTLEDIVVSMEAIALEKKIEMQKEIQTNLTIVQEEESIKQIVQILMDNALKYTNTNGTIKIILNKENKKIKLAIQNTGIGINKEDLPYIFDRFYQADKSRTKTDNSYGLGLSIAKIVVEKIGGEITVESTPNKITIFTVLL